jgi:hypothetical protein
MAFIFSHLHKELGAAKLNGPIFGPQAAVPAGKIELKNI